MSNGWPTRRDLLIAGGQLVTAAKLARSVELSVPAPAERVEVIPCLFSKPLGRRHFRELPRVLKALGINAVDLTCRPEGHVLPERVTDDLPAAVELLRAEGISVPMITTAIIDADQPHAETIVKTAVSLGIRHAKLGNYPYGDLRRIRATLADAKARIKDVAAMFLTHGLQAGYHNHSGNSVGAALWDVWELIRDLPPKAICSYYDLRHATVEGGLSGWAIGLNLLIDRIGMLAVKDFVWQRDEQQGWRAENVPLGQGMSPFGTALARLKEHGFHGPVSLHMEYGVFLPPIDSDHDKANLAAIRKDWNTMHKLLIQAKHLETRKG